MSLSGVLSSFAQIPPTHAFHFSAIIVIVVVAGEGAMGADGIGRMWHGDRHAG